MRHLIPAIWYHKVVMDNGPGDVAIIPPGHNAWVVGDEPVGNIDFTGYKDYAKRN